MHTTTRTIDRETSDTITEWFHHGSYILHEGRSWSWCHIILARVQLEYHCVWSSCTLWSGDKYQDVALLLRSIIMRAFRVSDELDWPPTADDMQFWRVPSTKAHPVPQFSHSWKGRRGIYSLVFSIEQNLCRAVSEAEWKLPKHVLLRLSVRHLFRSVQAAQDDTTQAWPLRVLWLWITDENCSGQGTGRSVNLSDAANRDGGKQYRISLR